MKRRILSLVLVLSLLIGAAMRPQRVDAVVATSAAVAASAAAILTACGVSYWAVSQTDAIDYITGKIDDYLDSIDETGTTYEDWLEISSTSQLFEVVSGGVLRFASGVANKLIDFAGWFIDDEGIESGGEPVGDKIIEAGYDISYSGTEFVGGFTVDVISDNILRVQLDGFEYDGLSNGTSYLNIVIPAKAQSGVISIVVSDVDNMTSTSLRTSTGKWSISNGDVRNSKITDGTATIAIVTGNYVGQPKTGSCILTLGDNANLNIDELALITPSDSVSIPAQVEDGGSFDVATSVSIPVGASVDSSTDIILDGITSEYGLSSEQAELPAVGWGWLQILIQNLIDIVDSGFSDINNFLAGLADTIYSKFTSILNDIKSGISSILSAIASLPTTIYTQFAQILQDIKTGISNIALDIYSDVVSALQYVFVPSQSFIDTYVASLYATFDNHFSILSYPFSILGEFITRMSGIGSPEPMFQWGNIYEPFSGKLLIAAGSYNLNSTLNNQTFAYIYQLYMVVVKGLLSFWFLKYLYSWFCDVFKMRESDYDVPEVDEI